MRTGRVAASALQGNHHSWKGPGGRFRAITASFVLDQAEASKRRLGKINHIVIIHREKKTIDNFDGVIKIKNIKEYGRSKIIFGLFC